MKKSIALLLLLCFVGFIVGQNKNKQKLIVSKNVDTKLAVIKDTVKDGKLHNTLQIDDSDTLDVELGVFKSFKKLAHASYYHDKFNGKRTASGKKFDNNKLTAAHRKLPFGTKLKITNEANGKFVIVEVTDRGPFSRGREIDLSRRAFFEIASNKKSGSMIVSIAKKL
jgi:rare lipoprotein A